MLLRDLIYYSVISTIYFNPLSLVNSLLVMSGAILLSHPFDTILTNIYYEKAGTISSRHFSDIYKELGYKGLFRGFFERTIVLGGGIAAGFASMYVIMRYLS